MHKRSWFLIPTLLVQLSAAGAAADLPKPPETAQKPVVDLVHGVKISDPYRWLEDQKSPETRAWIDRQNAYTKAYLDSLPGRKAIETALGPLFRQDSYSVPEVRDGRYFFTRLLASEDRAAICMRTERNGSDKILVDPRSVSADPTTSINIGDVSDDGTILAYTVRRGGEDEIEIHFRDTAKNTDLSDVLAKARYLRMTLAPDSSGLVYAHYTKEGTRVFFHKFGQPAASDRLIFGEGYTASQHIAVSYSEDGRYLLLSVSDGVPASRMELHYIDVKVGDWKVRPIVASTKAVIRPIVRSGRLFVWTNDAAPNGRVMSVAMDAPEPENWKQIIPEASDAIVGMDMAGGKIFVHYLADVKSRVRVFSTEGKALGEIPFPGPGTFSGLSGEWSKNEAFYSFASFLDPGTIYAYDAASGKSTRWWSPKVPFNASQFETKQVWYLSKDKTRIPMYLVYRRGLKMDGERPVYLTAYGGFNANRLPGYNPLIAWWVQQGGIFAQPNLRGGGEFGEKWHEAGMFERKQNVFDDFHGAAEFLIANHYTKAAKISIAGGSNGGLLVGAALTQRPDLYRAVLCSFPLLDMVRFHKKLVGYWWTTEYGTPDKAEDFAYIYKYSPYHHVKAGTRYPAVMIITGDADTRVDPMHARKMTALVQSATSSGYPVLLHYDTKAGHSRGLPISQQITDMTDQLLFLADQLGMPQKGS